MSAPNQGTYQTLTSRTGNPTHRVAPANSEAPNFNPPTNNVVDHQRVLNCLVEAVNYIHASMQLLYGPRIFTPLQPPTVNSPRPGPTFNPHAPEFQPPTTFPVPNTSATASQDPRSTAGRNVTSSQARRNSTQPRTRTAFADVFGPIPETVSRLQDALLNTPVATELYVPSRNPSEKPWMNTETGERPHYTSIKLPGLQDGLIDAMIMRGTGDPAAVRAEDVRSDTEKEALVRDSELAESMDAEMDIDDSTSRMGYQRRRGSIRRGSVVRRNQAALAQHDADVARGSSFTRSTLDPQPTEGYRPTAQPDDSQADEEDPNLGTDEGSETQPTGIRGGSGEEAEKQQAIFKPFDLDADFDEMLNTKPMPQSAADVELHPQYSDERAELLRKTDDLPVVAIFRDEIEREGIARGFERPDANVQKWHELVRWYQTRATSELQREMKLIVQDKQVFYGMLRERDAEAFEVTARKKREAEEAALEEHVKKSWDDVGKAAWGLSSSGGS